MKELRLIKQPALLGNTNIPLVLTPIGNLLMILIATPINLCVGHTGLSVQMNMSCFLKEVVGVSGSFPCMFSAFFYADCRLSMHLMFAS